MSVVLPKPAGAEMSVRGYFRLAWSKEVKRGRGIKVPDVTGTKNLVARSWLCMNIMRVSPIYEHLYFPTSNRSALSASNHLFCYSNIREQFPQSSYST